MKNNRDFEFRAWDTYNNCWTKHYLLMQLNGAIEALETDQPELMNIIKGHYKTKYEDSFRSYICPGVIDFSNFPQVIIQQYTGLKDSNGVKIFEGDIVKCIDHPTSAENVIGEVYFKEGSFRVKGSMIALGDYGTAWTTIIGNVFENQNQPVPDLNIS